MEFCQSEKVGTLKEYVRSLQLKGDVSQIIFLAKLSL